MSYGLKIWSLVIAGGAAAVLGGCSESTSISMMSAGRGAAPPLAVRLANYGPYEAGALAHLQSLGVKYVFMSVPKPGEVDEMQRKLAAHGLKALVVRGDADLSKDTAIDELSEQFETCRRMGVKYMFLSAKRRGASKEDVYDRLRRAGEAARSKGVTLALETHPDLGTNADVHRETMQAIHHPNVRVNFDTGNITYYNRGTSAVAELQKISEYVATVEIKDHNAEFETWNFPPLGKGAVNIPEVVRVLKAHGYDGPITIEVEGVKGIERSEEQIKADVAESVDYLRRVLDEVY